MKILATRKDGTTEVLTLKPPFASHKGESMDVLCCGDGMEHFFNNDDGTYDGWGCSVSSNQEAEGLLKQAFEGKVPEIKTQ